MGGVLVGWITEFLYSSILKCLLLNKCLLNWILTLMKGTLMIRQALEFQLTEMEMVDYRTIWKEKSGHKL